MPGALPCSGTRGAYAVYRSNWTLRAGLRARRQLRALRRHARLDAVYFHTQVPAVLNRSWLSSLPSVVSLDATPRQYDSLGAGYGHQRGPKWLERGKDRLTRRALASVDHLVSFSRWTQQALVEEYGLDLRSISVIPPGIDLARWQVPTRKGRTGTLRILFVGGEFRRKGGPALLEAFATLADLDVELHVVTRASVDPAPGVVVHQGLSPNSQELMDLYAAADVFALPTTADTLGIALCEAGAAGLPSVTTDVGAVAEVVQDGKTGLLVPPDDVAVLASALRRLLDDEDLRLQLGEAARAHVSQHYDGQVNGARLAELCRAVASGRTVQSD